MKRGASIQLTREKSEDEDIEDGEPGQGFKKADETVLAARPMRGLPRRDNPTAATFDALGSKDKPNTGTGVPSFAPPGSTFTFNTSSPLPVPSASQTPSTNAPFKFTNSAVAPSASSASKQLSNFLSSQPNGAPPVNREASFGAVENDSDEAKYFSSLRGLNETFRAEVAELLSSDPFFDFTGLLDAYKEYRSKIQKDFDESRKVQGKSKPNGIYSASSFNSKPTSTTTQTPPAPSLPVAPKSFAGFGVPASTSSSSASNESASSGGGFKPNFAAMSSSSTMKSPFSFPTASSTTSEKPATTFSPFGVPASSTSVTKPSPFGTSGLFSKQTPFGGAPSSSPFGSTSVTSTDGPQTTLSPSGSGSVSFFGGISSSEKSGAPSNATTTSSNIFGSGSTTNSTSAPSFGTANASQSAFAGGGAKSPSGNLGNPVGFSFGSAESTPDPENSKGATAVATGGLFSSAKINSAFGSSPFAPSSISFGSGAGTTSTSNQDWTSASVKPTTAPTTTSAVESRSSTPFSAEGGEATTEESTVQKALGENPNDLEGEGEEDETSTHTSKVKIYRFGKEGSDPRWVEVGVGMLRIKKHKVTGSLRLLSRNSANGKIMMNFKLYSGFKITRAKHILNFVGHDNGANVTYRVRVKDEAGAIALQDAIEKEVSSL